MSQNASMTLATTFGDAKDPAPFPCMLLVFRGHTSSSMRSDSDG